MFLLPTWTPDLVPALWRKVEILSEDAVRIWAAGIDYIVGDEVAYPDENGTRYTCQQAHTAQARCPRSVAGEGLRFSRRINR